MLTGVNDNLGNQQGAGGDVFVKICNGAGNHSSFDKLWPCADDGDDFHELNTGNKLLVMGYG